MGFYEGLINQLAKLGTVDRKLGTNFMLAVIKGIEPRDQIEAMLGAQMAAVHVASMTFARRLACVETIPHRTAPKTPSTSSRAPSPLRSRRSSDTEAAASKR